LTVANTAAVGNTTVTGFINTTSSANVGTTLNVGTNANIGGYINVVSTANVGGVANFRNNVIANGTLTVANTVAIGNTTVTGFVNVSSSANVAGSLQVGTSSVLSGNVTVGGTTTFKTEYVLDVFANTNLGSNTTAPQQIYSFTKTAYKTAKFMVKAANTGGTNQMADMIVAHDGTTPYITVFGVVPDTAPIGEFSVTSNTTHIILRMQQTEASCKTTVVANLIK
jgi:UDP-3-O-[3-hydroxymyristoyl] glucosamine N-acyltransferase